jgi:Xaa-Pro aminopeptidase
MSKRRKSIYKMSYGRNAYDWRMGVNVDRMRKERLAKAQKQMKEKDLDALILLDLANVRYTTSTATPPWMIRVPGWRYAVVVRDQVPLLYEHGDIRYTMLEEAPWLEGNIKSAIVWLRGSTGKWPETIAQRWAEDIKQELKARGVTGGRIGLDIHDGFALRGLKAVDIEPVDGQTAMVDARKIKTEDEVECLRIACAISEAVFSEVKRNIRPGVTERELVGIGSKVAWALGCDDIIGFTVCSGHYGWPNFKFHTDRMVRPGEIVTFDCGGLAWNGYLADWYRVFSCGQPNERQKDYYRRTYDWLYSAIRSIKPGVTTAELAEKWPDSTKEWGYRNEWEAIANQWGHGIGLALYEPPNISRAFSFEFPQKIEENMTFAVETQDGRPHDGGVRIEEMVRVTSGGCEVLTKWPSEEITVVDI